MSTVVAVQESRSRPRYSPWVLAWSAALALTLVIYLLRDVWPAAWQYPRDWDIPLRFWISSFMKWLVNDFDLGLFTAFFRLP